MVGGGGGGGSRAGASTAPHFSTALHFEAATQRCSLEKLFWKYAANVRENTHAEARFE